MYTPVNPSFTILLKNLTTSTYVFPLFNTESLIFKIENTFKVQGPFEIIPRQDRQLVHINSFQKANGVNNIRPTDSEKKCIFLSKSDIFSLIECTTLWDVNSQLLI